MINCFGTEAIVRHSDWTTNRHNHEGHEEHEGGIRRVLDNMIGYAIEVYRHLGAGLLDSTGQIWKAVSNDSFVLFVSFVVRNQGRL